MQRYIKVYQSRELANACIEADFAPMLSAQKIKRAFDHLEAALLASGHDPDAIYQEAMKAEIDSATALLFMIIQTSRLTGQPTDLDRQKFEASCATAVAFAVGEVGVLIDSPTDDRSKRPDPSEMTAEPKSPSGVPIEPPSAGSIGLPMAVLPLGDIGSLAVDEKGISDSAGNYVITPANAVSALDDFAILTGTQRQSLVIQRVFGVSGEAGEILIEHRLVRDGVVWFVIEEDRLDPATGDIYPKEGGTISVLTHQIADKAGARSGDPIGGIDGFRINIHCLAGEGAVTCHSPYSSKVEYMLQKSDSVLSPQGFKKHGGKIIVSGIKIVM